MEIPETNTETSACNGDVIREERERLKDNIANSSKENGVAVAEEEMPEISSSKDSVTTAETSDRVEDKGTKEPSTPKVSNETEKESNPSEEVAEASKQSIDLPPTATVSPESRNSSVSQSGPSGSSTTLTSPKDSTKSSAPPPPDLKALEQRLNAFKQWCDTNLLTTSEKVTLEFTGTSHRYGMVASSDIKRGETLFTIPRNLLLNPQHGTLAVELQEYEDWLESLGRSLEDSSGWVPLLITLMHEFTKEDSFWAPYLKLVPEISEFGHPLFWDMEDMKHELSGMSLLYDLDEDRKNIEEEYKLYVLPFLVQNKNLSRSLEKFNMDLFKRMIAFVMAYSFTEDQEESPSMIPMADMLNHHSNNNANLIYQRDCLKMISCRRIDKGEEIYNTFGRLGNAELLQMYGYTEKENHYNTVPIYVQAFVDVIEKDERVPQSYLQAMVALMHNTEIAFSYDYFVFDKNGLRRGPDLIQFLKILHMSEAEFDKVLKTRAGNRPDSFYQKLLRKLKLAKKTDMSSGVAVIDITDDDNEGPSPGKRKCFQLEEGENAENGEGIIAKRQCLYDDDTGVLMTTNGTTASLSHFPDSLSTNDMQKLSHYPTVTTTAPVNGDTSVEPIVIDDDESDDEEENQSPETMNVANSSSEISVSNNETESALNNETESVPNNKTESVPNNETESVSSNETESAPKNETKSDPKNETESATKNESKINQINSDNKTESESTENEKSFNANNDLIEIINKDDATKIDTTTSSEPKDSATELTKDSIDKGSSTNALDLDAEVPDDTCKTELDNDDESTLDTKLEGIVNDNCKPKNNDTTMERADSSASNVVTISEDTPMKASTAIVFKDGAEVVDEVIEEDSALEINGEDEDDDDDDDIEIVSEDVGCLLTYEKLKGMLKPEWKETIKEVLNTLLSSMKKDDDVIENPEKTLSRNQYNASCVRKGQRTLIQTFLQSLS